MRRNGLISNRIVARRFKNRRNSSIGKLRRVVYILYITCIYIETSSGHDGSGLSRLSARRERRDIRSILFGVKGGSPYKRVALVSPPESTTRKRIKRGLIHHSLFGARRRLVLAARRIVGGAMRRRMKEDKRGSRARDLRTQGYTWTRGSIYTVKTRKRGWWD